jgi:soluble epoxide hydrolase / lipid-phosphate phosphatase
MREFLLKDNMVPLKKYAQEPAIKNRYMRRFRRDGFEAPNMWYHAMTFNHHINVEKELLKERMKVMVPMLFLGCTGDAVGLTKCIEAPKQAGLLPDMTIKEFESGYWCTWEIPDQIGSAMVEWLKEKRI